MKNIKIIFVALAFLLLCIEGFSQDIIYKKDGTKQKAIIEEINPTEVVFKKYDRQEGPTYRILKTSILLIEFADGTIEVYNRDGEQKNNGEENNSLPNKAFAKALGRNILSLNYLHILNGNLHLGYERISKSGIIGLKLSVNTNIDDVESDIIAYRRLFTTGLDFNIYPTGQGKIKYFVGPSFRVGVVSDDYAFWMTGRPESLELNYRGVFFNNGFNIQVTPKFYLGFQGAVGIGRFTNAGSKVAYSEVDGMIAFNMGYRF